MPLVYRGAPTLAMVGPNSGAWSTMSFLEHLSAIFVQAVWSTPLVIFLLGGGLFFAIYSRLLPYRHLGHAIGLVLGRHATRSAPGELSHAQALAAALSGTLGLGNISGVALAVSAGGPGAVFWMWLSALVGIATKFFTCTLGVMYRGNDSLGRLQGGPMYVIREGLPRVFYPLAIMFAVAGLVGTLPIYQANQLAVVVRENLLDGRGGLLINTGIGLAMAAVVAGVVFGGLRRVAHVAVSLVPLMVITYLGMTAFVLVEHAGKLPALLGSIVTHAFNPQAVGGGILGVALIGVSRAVFSNEAGVGTEVMAHGAARTPEPVREGLVAMLGPIIDTLVVCTCTALVLLLAGDWRDTDGISGITLTLAAFEQALGAVGGILLSLVALILSMTTMFTMWYYGAKCFGFLFGAQHQHHYRWFFIAMVVFGATVSLNVVWNLVSGSYGLMAIPTMLSSLLLAPRVREAARDYFQRHPY